MRTCLRVKSQIQPLLWTADGGQTDPSVKQSIDLEEGLRDASQSPLGGGSRVGPN
jgi:hypothetical protein